MQIDMHYYGTYALARMAGLKKSAAFEIAMAAQLVDDCAHISLPLLDGVFLHHEPTAHHPIQLAANSDPAEQRRAWIPFHFLPGNQGKSVEERLVCVAGSAIAQEVLQHALQNAQGPQGAAQIGVAAHAYADTFAHYGFSGIASKRNRVKSGSFDLKVKNPNIWKYITSKAEAFFAKHVTEIATLDGLGHASVATYPDRPYLQWSFTYEDGQPSGARSNPETYRLACEKLYLFFSHYAEQQPEQVESGQKINYLAVRKQVETILAFEGPLNERIDQWKMALQSGVLIPGHQETIPTYDYAQFRATAEALCTIASQEAHHTFPFRFFLAAKTHREFVLYDLLPRYDLAVITP